MRSDPDPTRINLLPVVTLVLWLMCVLAACINHIAFSAPPAVPVPATKRTEAILIDVSLTDPSASLAEPTPVVPDVPQSAVPPLPQLPAVTPISPAIGFAVPVQGPSRIVSKAQAIVQQQPASPHETGPVYTQIFYGKGEGKQPAPEYPLESKIAGQAGTVGVEFTVGEDGSVTAARVSKPCQWPLLNQAAERSIRETWTYSPGPTRHYFLNVVYAPKAE